MTLLIAVPDSSMLDYLVSRVPAGVDLVIWRPGDEPLERVIDLLAMPYMVTYASLATLGGLVRNVQLQSLGFDGAARYLPEGISVSNAVGVHEAPTAEMAMTLLLASLRGWPELARDQASERWSRPVYSGLLGARILLIGVGGIGGEFEKRIDGFGAELTRVGRTARDGIHAMSELPELLPSADAVVLAIPLNGETRHMVDGEFLDRLPHGSVVINVSRGPIVDTDALVERVRSGAVRAALDVVDPEPLPAGHPLWSLPGSLIAPHLGGNVSTINDRAYPMILAQVERLAAGERVANVVLPKDDGGEAPATEASPVAS